MKHIGKFTKYGIMEEFYYTAEHTWASISPDGTARVGITDFAQKSLGTLVGFELPAVDDEVTQMEPFGVVESSKTASDLFAPLSGKVKVTNDNVIDDPEVVNWDPYGEGWIMEIIPDNLEQELKELMSSDAAVRWMKGEVENTGEPV